MIPKCKKNESVISELREQINNLTTKTNKGYSEVLYENTEGFIAGSSGNSVALSNPVTFFSAILIVHANGVSIVDNKLNQNNPGTGINMYWFNEGYGGTFYNNTIYKIIGICRK